MLLLGGSDDPRAAKKKEYAIAWLFFLLPLLLALFRTAQCLLNGIYHPQKKTPALDLIPNQVVIIKRKESSRCSARPRWLFFACFFAWFLLPGGPLPGLCLPLLALVFWPVVAASRPP